MGRSKLGAKFMILLATIPLLILVLAVPLQAYEGRLGISQCSATSGRSIPGFYASVGGASWWVSAAGVSVYNSYYVHAFYQTGVFLDGGKSGSFLGGDLAWGLGVGGTYSYREAAFSDSESFSRSEDMTIGPAFHVSWLLLNPAFIGMEIVLGLRNLPLHLVLAFQESSVFVVGVTF